MVYQCLTNVEGENLTEDDIIIESMSSSERILIVLKNDSILEYNKIYGGVGSSVTVKYLLDGNFITIEPLDIYGKSYPYELLNARLVFSLDSLVDKKNERKYLRAR